MSKDDTLSEEQVLLVQKHQQDVATNQITSISDGLDHLEKQQQSQDLELDDMLAFLEGELANTQDDSFQESEGYIDVVDTIVNGSTDAVQPSFQLPLVDMLNISDDASWSDYQTQVQHYASKHSVDLDVDPFSKLLSEQQRLNIEKRIKDDLTLKSANCDKYDYLIAGTSGLIAGLVDVLFVGMPGEGVLTKASDGAVDSMVEKFASMNGWQGGKEGKDSTSSAIGFLERKFEVGYDHRHGQDVGGAFKMSTQNHHIKSLEHSPDLTGLFFSILGQFTGNAHFADSGSLITVDKNNKGLVGADLVSKVYCGFVNWAGHLFSDVAGSSGAQGRGTGIPIPFFSLLQFVNVGEFGQHKQTFDKIAVQVFEQGYDFRHGVAMAIPVLIAELLTRFMWVMKQRFYHKADWKDCIPTANNPELRRMLLVAHGSLCLVDAADAGIRSGGEIIQFMLRSNIVAWARFGSLALKEIQVWYRAGGIDHEAANNYMDKELERILRG